MLGVHPQESDLHIAARGVMEKNLVLPYDYLKVISQKVTLMSMVQ